MKQYILVAMLAIGIAVSLPAAMSADVVVHSREVELPQTLLEAILAQAQPDLPALEDLTMSEMVGLYEDGLIAISYQGRDPQNPDYSLYKVEAGGGMTVLGILEGL